MPVFRQIFGKLGKPDRFLVDGKEVTEAEYEAQMVRPAEPFKGCASLIGWKPLVSDALAVHPDQVAEARADALAKGVPVDFLPDGRPVFTSRAQRKAYCKAYGFFDRSAGYGDAAPGQSGLQKQDPLDPATELLRELSRQRGGSGTGRPDQKEKIEREIERRRKMLEGSR